MASSVVVFTLGARRLLWAREEWQGRDIDGDGEIGEPTHVRVELHDQANKQTRFADLPVTLAELQRVAVAVLKNGRAFSRPALRGVLSQGKFNRLAAEMERRGLCVKLPGNRRELLASGKAVLRQVLEE